MTGNFSDETCTKCHFLELQEEKLQTKKENFLSEPSCSAKKKQSKVKERSVLIVATM